MNSSQALLATVYCLTCLQDNCSLEPADTDVWARGSQAVGLCGMLSRRISERN